MQMWKLATPKSAGWARSLETWEEPSYSSSSVGMSYATAPFLMVSAPAEMFFLLPLIQILFILPLGWTGLISLQSMGLSRVFSSTRA